MIGIAIGAFHGTSYAQFSVTVTGATPSGTPIPNATSSPAPSAQFNVTATVAGNSNSVTKVVFYRNDVPYITDTNSPYQIPQNLLGQETYTYHARAYDSTGIWVDSNDYKLIFHTPQIIRMGDPYAPVTTQLPGRFVDHTTGIQNAVNWLGNNGGGTLFFPCTIPSNDGIAVYNIKSTIRIPSNVTLQAESAELGSRCRIYWNDVLHLDPWQCGDSPTHLRNAPMFRIVGGTSRVRFRDLYLMSRTTGSGCDNRNDYDRIEIENTAAVELNTDHESGTGDITDIIFENVAITHFTRGIKAVSNNASEAENEISGVKIRAFRPDGNTVALYIDAKFAYNWDIQNFNPGGILPGQGAIEIINAGKPSATDGENTKIKFLQLNCNGHRTLTPPKPFCVKVQKHGGLYFRQLHQEGIDKAIIVEDISSRSGPNTNPDPIVFESSGASGEFNDASMKLYLIGNGITSAPEIFQAGLDDNRMHFKGAGRNSTVVDCGDIHADWTDLDGGNPEWEDFLMLFSHSERYRGSFFAQTGSASYLKPHTYCPSGVSGLPSIDEIGGEFFDNGILPNEPGLYSNELNAYNCFAACDVADQLDILLANGGSVYINGTFTLDRTVTIPRGSQIIGAPNAELILGVPNVPLFKIDVRILTQQNQFRYSGTVIRNLRLSTIQSSTTGIALIGEYDSDPPSTGPRAGVSSDIHFSGLSFHGFTTGLLAAPAASGQGHPMIDGVSMKSLSFVNNATAVLNTSANSSNWNVMDLNIQTNATDTLGWTQVYGGHQSLQDVSCTGGSTGKMKDCIRLQMVGGFFLNGLKQTTHVTNALTVGENGNVGHGTIYQAPLSTSMVLRNSDFTSTVTNSGRMNVLGKAFITSMNNKYQFFNVESTYYGDESRLTYCGDSYAGGTAYPGLDDLHPNLWVGLPTPTRVQCGTRPIPWDEAVRWTNNFDEDWVGTPLVGNFFHDTQEDFVVYRPGTQSQFLIQQPGGPGRLAIDWGMTGDSPLIGRFFPNSRAQIVIFRNGQWWINDPNNSANNSVWNWGLSGDKPFIGNFLDESGSVSGNKDEIAIYRPSTKTFWILNPRSFGTTAFATTADADSEIQVADFLGVGYDQIAQYKAGVWKIVDPRTGSTHTVNFGQTGDIPVAGKYLVTLPLKDPCAQVGVWRPSSQEFFVADPFSNCGTRSTNMVWGSNNGSFADDIPLTINAADAPLLRRPVAYRVTKGLYDHSLADGQWWVHDRF